jgi:hypothetical protein
LNAWQIIAVLFVNYKGRPWMNGLTENHPLFLSIFACIGGVTFLAFEVRSHTPELPEETVVFVLTLA